MYTYFKHGQFDYCNANVREPQPQTQNEQQTPPFALLEQVFQEIIKMGLDYKDNSDDLVDEVMKLLAEESLGSGRADKHDDDE